MTIDRTKALDCAVAPPIDPWQPISTAPKDGMKMLLCGDPKRYGNPFEIGCWNESRQSWGSFGPTGDVIAWQPLPPPPGAPANQQRKTGVTQASESLANTFPSPSPAVRDALEEITPECTPVGVTHHSQPRKEITPSGKEVRAVVVALRDATSTFISAGTLRKMAHDAIRAFRLVQSPANPLYGASALSPTVRDAPQDKSDDCYTGEDK